eukprot:gene3274-3551_t
MDPASVSRASTCYRALAARQENAREYGKALDKIHPVLCGALMEQHIHVPKYNVLHAMRCSTGPDDCPWLLDATNLAAHERELLSGTFSQSADLAKAKQQMKVPALVEMYFMCNAGKAPHPLVTAGVARRRLACATYGIVPELLRKFEFLVLVGGAPSNLLQAYPRAVAQDFDLCILVNCARACNMRRRQVRQYLASHMVLEVEVVTAMCVTYVVRRPGAAASEAIMVQVRLMPFLDEADCIIRFDLTGCSFLAKGPAPAFFGTEAAAIHMLTGVGMMLDPRPLSVKRLLKYAARDIHHVISHSAMAELELKEAMLFRREGREEVVKEADEFGLGAYEVLGPQAMVLSA